MDIAEVAKRSGVPASALRYYERRGLIRSLAHDGARRRFAPSVLDQLALIALGQAAGFALDEIRTMLTAQGAAQIDRSLLSAKADQLDQAARQLRAVSRACGMPPSARAEPRRVPILPAPAHGGGGRRPGGPAGDPAGAPRRVRPMPAPQDALSFASRGGWNGAGRECVYPREAASAWSHHPLEYPMHLTHFAPRSQSASPAARPAAKAATIRRHWPCCFAAAPQAQAADGISDPAGDFLGSFTGAHAGDLTSCRPPCCTTPPATSSASRPPLPAMWARRRRPSSGA